MVVMSFSFSVYLSTAVFLGLIGVVAADAIVSEPKALPSQCPSSGVLSLKAGDYYGNVSLGNCTIVGAAPGAVIHGNIKFDYGMLMGIIHFEGEGATSSCIEGSVEVKGDDMRFHGCDIPYKGSHGWNQVKVSGGKARFEHGGSLCGLTVVGGSINITNVTGCWGSLQVGPGTVNLNVDIDVRRYGGEIQQYGGVNIDGMKGRLGGTIRLADSFRVVNSVVEFDTFTPIGEYNTFLSMDNVTGSGTVEYQAYGHQGVYISNCKFNGMAFSASMARGFGSISNTKWRGGMLFIGWSAPLSFSGLRIENSDFLNVFVSGRFPGYTDITSSNVSGKIALEMQDVSSPWPETALTITKSRVVFLPGEDQSGSSSVPGPIRISSSTVSFPGSSRALLGASHLTVNRSTILVTNVRHASPIVFLPGDDPTCGDMHIYDANIDVTNCSVPWVSQSFAKIGQIIV